MMIDVLNYPSPEAGDATTVYAIGDVHGRLDLIQHIEKSIEDDILQMKDDHPVICYLGDYVDRGPQSAQVIEHLASRSQDVTPRVFLKGNHEDRMLAFLADPVPIGPSWIKFGGREALESYGLQIPNEPTEEDWSHLGHALAAALPPAHLEFLTRLRLAFVWRDYVFVHAGLNPQKPIDQQSAHDLMWIREPFLSSYKNWGVRVVHGHVIVPTPEFRENRIGIDTGAYESGCLTCLVVSAGGTRLLQTTASL